MVQSHYQAELTLVRLPYMIDEINLIIIRKKKYVLILQLKQKKKKMEILIIKYYYFYIILQIFKKKFKVDLFLPKLNPLTFLIILLHPKYFL